jgi:hypothetical protein
MKTRGVLSRRLLAVGEVEGIGRADHRKVIAVPAFPEETVPVREGRRKRGDTIAVPEVPAIGMVDDTEGAPRLFGGSGIAQALQRFLAQATTNVMTEVRGHGLKTRQEPLRDWPVLRTLPCQGFRRLSNGHPLRGEFFDRLPHEHAPPGLLDRLAEVFALERSKAEELKNPTLIIGIGPAEKGVQYPRMRTVLSMQVCILNAGVRVPALLVPKVQQQFLLDQPPQAATGYVQALVGTQEPREEQGDRLALKAYHRSLEKRAVDV